jgi:hypothetical protein
MIILVLLFIEMTVKIQNNTKGMGTGEGDRRLIEKTDNYWLLCALLHVLLCLLVSCHDGLHIMLKFLTHVHEITMSK